MSSTNPDSKPANLITALRLRSGQAWTQRDWCWIVVFMLFLQRILIANVLHYSDHLCYNGLRQARQ